MSIDKDITDIFINEKKGISFRTNNLIKLKPTSKKVVEKIYSAFILNLTQNEREIYRKNFSFSTSYSLNQYRYRLLYYKEYSGNAISIRVINQKAWNCYKLGYPINVIDEIVNSSYGLVFISGPTSAGKSTTMSSILSQIGREKEYHIMTIEDPIEFVYNSKKSLYSQREVGTDVESYEKAIIDCMRANPNVIALGEIRDSKTAIEALKAAQTGHLVISTLHANNVINTIERFLGLFPDSYKMTAKNDLSSVLKAILSQKIIKTKNNEVKMISEYIFGKTSVLNKIKGNPNELIQLRSIMEHENIKSIDYHLKSLLDNDIISESTFLANISSYEKKIKN